MINAKLLQNAYVKLYKELREFLWDMPVIELIAELEVATFTAFPDIEDISNKLKKLSQLGKSIIEEDNDLKLRIDEFEKLLEEQPTVYASLKTFKEEA